MYHRMLNHLWTNIVHRYTKLKVDNFWFCGSLLHLPFLEENNEKVSLESTYSILLKKNQNS